MMVVLHGVVVVTMDGGVVVVTPAVVPAEHKGQHCPSGVTSVSPYKKTRSTAVPRKTIQ